MEVESRYEKPSALTDWVYARLKEDILNLRFPMGAQLHVEGLAESLGTSRTPVREAIFRLEKSGLVRTVPRVGSFVTQITLRDLKELFDIRQVLESYAVGLVSPLLSNEDLAHLDAVVARGAIGIEEGELAEFLKAEIEFHTFFMERAPNRHLVTIMEELRDQTYRERILSLKSARNVSESLKEHKKIVDVLRHCDSDEATRAMARHIGAARDRLVAFLELPEGDGVREDKEKEG